jgi:superoxide dismutase, Cu-Zn family
MSGFRPAMRLMDQAAIRPAQLSRSVPMPFPLALTLAAGLLMPTPAPDGDELLVLIETVDARGSLAAIGHIRLRDSRHGLVLMPELSGLPPGLHGFHVHQNPSCFPAQKDGQAQAAGGAGPHLDPHAAHHHGSPWGEGHLGDLPALTVDAEGRARQPLLAPRLRLEQVMARSLVIHAGGDNHADTPQPLGGGGARIACGVVGVLLPRVQP